MQKQAELSMRALSNKTEKIRTGQSFLYRQDGYESMIVEIQLKDKIDGETLKKAFAKTLPRYQYLAQKFMIDQGDFYLMPNSKPFHIRQSSTFMPLGGREVNEHLLDVHYSGNSLFIAYHHGICDGRGILPFVRTLVYYYTSIFYKRVLNIQDVQFASSPILEGENSEPSLVTTLGEASTQMPEIHKKGYSLPEAKNQTERLALSYHSRIKIDSDSFFAFSKSIGATPAIAISLLFSEAIQRCKAEEDGLPIICNLATDLRSALESSLVNTQRNCVGSFQLPYDNNKDADHQYLAKVYRQRITDFKSPQNMKQALRKILALSDRLDKVSSFREKQLLLSFFETLLLDTYILSYIGQLNLGDAEEYIREIHTYTSGTRGLSIEMFAMKDALFLDVMQSFSDQKYITSFLEIMKEEKIQFEAKPIREISIPKDNIQESLSVEQNYKH